jgi:hypothetical protein
MSEPMLRSTQVRFHLSLWYVWCKPCTCLALRLALSLKGPKWASTWAPSPSGTIRCIQNDFWAYGTSSANHEPILNRHLNCLQMERREISHDPRHLGVPSGASKMTYENMVRSMQTVHLPCAKISNISKRTELSLEPRHLGVPSGASKSSF